MISPGERQAVVGMGVRVYLALVLAVFATQAFCHSVDDLLDKVQHVRRARIVVDKVNSLLDQAIADVDGKLRYALLNESSDFNLPACTHMHQRPVLCC